MAWGLVGFVSTLGSWLQQDLHVANASLIEVFPLLSYDIQLESTRLEELCAISPPESMWQSQVGALPGMRLGLSRVPRLPRKPV